MRSSPTVVVTLLLLAAGVACGSSPPSTSVLTSGSSPSSAPAESPGGVVTATPTTSPAATVTRATPAATTGIASAAPRVTGLASPLRSSLPTAPPTTAPTRSSSPTVLTESSSGNTVQIKIGRSIYVTLPGGANGGYDQPATSSTSVARRTSASGGYPTNQPAQATFTGAKPGTADLTSQTDYTCLNSNPRCLPPQKQWLVPRHRDRLTAARGRTVSPP